MARRKNQPHASQGDAHAPAGGGTRARVLLVTPCPATRDALALALTAFPNLAWSPDAAHARTFVRSRRFDAVIIDASLPDACGLTASICATLPNASCVMYGGAPCLETAVAAMRSGAVDVVLASQAGDLAARLAPAACRARTLMAQELLRDRARRRVAAHCRDLHESRHALLAQVGTLCRDLAQTQRDMSEQLQRASMASELNAILRQELDLESLLRTTLEYVLKRVGPTNAVVYLPAASGDYSLGAYVNYDCPKDSAETMLDRLADTIAPGFEHLENVVVLRGEAELVRTLGEQAEWLHDSTLAAFSCRQDGECLGVVALFRDRRNPFPATLLPTLRIICDLFGKQLARVIRTHHRHLPKDKWGGLGDHGRGPDDIDLAA